MSGLRIGSSKDDILTLNSEIGKPAIAVAAFSGLG